MPSFLSQQIPPPENWQDFEKLCQDLWARIWGDPDTQRNGRTGQEQVGVDVFGRLNGIGDWQGVQCKGKDGRFGKAVTEKELRDEVEKAKKFRPPLKAFILATTAPSDAKIQEAAREITEEHKAKGLFSVAVFGWDEIHTRLAEPAHGDVVDKHYSGQGPKMHNVDRKLDGLSAILEQFRAVEFAQEIAKSLAEQGATLQMPSADGESDPHDVALNREIDSYRERVETAPRTALGLLNDLKDRSWEQASKRTRFRIVTNIGAAHLELGEWEEAADLFIEATKYTTEDDDKAARNLAVAYLYKKDFKRAEVEAKHAIELNPDEADGYSVLVAARVEGGTLGIPEEAIPEEFLTKPNVAYTLSHAYRSLGDHRKALEWIKKAHELAPESLSYRASLGSELLEKVLGRPGVTFESYLNEEGMADAGQAIRLLQGVWSEVQKTEVAESYAWVCANLCIAMSVVGRIDEAKALMPEAIELNADATELRKVAAIIESERGKPNEALAYVAYVPQGRDVEIDLLRAQLLAETGQFEEALKAVDAISIPQEKEGHRAAALGFRLRLIAETRNREEALSAAEEAEREYPDEPVLLASIARVHLRLKDNEAALEKALTALGLLSDDSGPAACMAVADILFDLEQFIDAAGVYASIVNNYEDSPALRRLLISQINADQRKDALDTLGCLSPAMREQEFYRRCATKIYIQSGELDKALKEAESYLMKAPDDLDVRLKWIGLNQRLGCHEMVREFLSSLPKFPDAVPINNVYLAHLFVDYGFPEHGLRLAYRLLRDHPEVPDVHLGYIGLLLPSRIPEELLSASEVGKDTAFVVEDTRERQQTFIVEGTWSDKRFPEEIPPTHPYAQQANGKKAGDTFVVRPNPVQEEEWKVADVKSKYLYILHKTMDEFSTSFPEANGFWKIHVGAKGGSEEFDFSPIFKAVDDRHALVKQVEELYQTNGYPVSFMAKLLGENPLKVWRGLLEGSRLPIRCCLGTLPERNAALSLASTDTAQFVVDPLTLFSLVSLGIHEELTQTFGPLGVTQSALDMYRGFVERERQAPSTGSMGKAGDKYQMTEFTAEELEEYLVKYDEVAKWAKENCEVIPAAANTPRDLLPLTDQIHPAIVDTILAAEASGRILLCDDQHVRALAKELKRVEGVWVQIAMMIAKERGELPPEKYYRAVVDSLNAGVEFTTIDENVMLWVSEDEHWEPTERVKRVFRTLGGEKADLRSSTKVVMEFLQALWARDLPLEKRELLTRELLRALTSKHQNVAPHILKVLVVKGQGWNGEARELFLTLLDRWCDEHDIKLPDQPKPKASLLYQRFASYKDFLMGTTCRTIRPW